MTILTELFPIYSLNGANAIYIYFLILYANMKNLIRPRVSFDTLRSKHEMSYSIYKEIISFKSYFRINHNYHDWSQFGMQL